MKPGLKEILATVASTQCPFCKAPRAKRNGPPGRQPETCNTGECPKLWVRFYERDYYREKRASR